MIALLLTWLGWTALALLLGLFIGLSIRLADEIEQPDLDDTAEIYVPREWVA